MPLTSRFLVFLSAALILAITPGPGIFYVLARSLRGGRREGALSAAGTFLGGLVHVAAAAFGLSAILAASAIAFQTVRYAGAVYLIYLGYRMIRSRDQQPAESELETGGNTFRQGVMTEVLNPKTALFFLSFIPQFVSVQQGHVAAQFLMLGAISVTLNTCADLLVACFAGPLGARMQRSAKLRGRQRAASGVAMIGLGVYVAAARGRA
ncbi:MAG TPA: LysE family translocator [Bryobacteraceae bacterium]|jgi:threonine/homoserine/homoserine lactone efflux protein|nr:LysE family translocator [Bryobacteraceae bacterium]